MDLAKFDTATLAEKGAPINLVAPNGDVVIGSDGEAVVWYMYGQDSKVFRDLINEARRSSVGKKNKAKTPDEEENELIDKVAKLTAGWSENFDLDGKPFKFSHENAVKIYSDSRFKWIYEQMNRAVMDRANFLAQ